MRKSLPRELRLEEQAQRGLAAQRLIEDDVVLAWFESRRLELIEIMIAAPVSDDETRRDAAVDLKALAGLKRHLELEAGQGKAALAAIEKRKA